VGAITVGNGSVGTTFTIAGKVDGSVTTAGKVVSNG
jgi:hypothetical protein